MGLFGFGKKDLRPKDPVCGKPVDPFHAGGQHVHQGREYVFCSVNCMSEFKVNPKKYAEPPTSGQKIPARE